ncbi:hypothetical protein V8C26DRAFT_281741 [Trichoderma gracile]
MVMLFKPVILRPDDGREHRRNEYNPSSRRSWLQQSIDAIIVAPRRLRKTLLTAQPQQTCKVTCASATKAVTHTHQHPHTHTRTHEAEANDGRSRWHSSGGTAGQPRSHLGTPDLRMQKSKGREQQPSPMADGQRGWANGDDSRAREDSNWTCRFRGNFWHESNGEAPLLLVLLPDGSSGHRAASPRWSPWSQAVSSWFVWLGAERGG